MMLEEVMRYINNRFDHGMDGAEIGSTTGEFEIEDGTLEIEGLIDGQYFWIEGSVLNDGLHQYPASGLKDETFKGRIVFLRVPPAVETMAEEIEGWCVDNADAIDGPYQSESFGGYSYSKGQAGAEGNEMPPAAWQTQFGARLRPYRKLSRRWV